MAEKKKPAEEMQDEAPQVDAAAEAEKILEEARAKAAAIVADAKAEAAAEIKAAKETAQKDDTVAKEAAPAHVPYDDMVPIRLFKDNGKYKDDVFVAVNGERVQIKRGETVEVKRMFAEVLEQSMNQDTATANLIDQESNRYAEEAKARGV